MDTLSRELADPISLAERCASLLSANGGLFVDVDGTISRLAATPGEASVSELCRGALACLVDRVGKVVVLSGRSTRDAKRMVGLERAVYVGNHGIEVLQDDEVVYEPGALETVGALQRIRTSLEGKMCALPGVVLEDKVVSLSVHYRRAVDPVLARHLILEIIAQQSIDSGLHLFEGKRVIEVRASVPSSKGVALKRLVSRYRLEAIAVLGDDLTDVTAFVAAKELGAGGRCATLCVAVLGDEPCQRLVEVADECLAGVGEVERFLECLCALLGRHD